MVEDGVHRIVVVDKVLGVIVVEVVVHEDGGAKEKTP